MPDLTATQQKVLDVLGGSWLSPREVAERVGDYLNAGGAAASLRVLMRRGLVQQQVKDRRGRWTLYEYRRAAEVKSA